MNEGKSKIIGNIVIALILAIAMVSSCFIGVRGLASISVKLDGSIMADQNASIVKAMVVTISSKPILVYNAIFDSLTTTESHVINEDTSVIIGDCKLKIGMKDGIITYYLRENK